MGRPFSSYDKSYESPESREKSNVEDRLRWAKEFLGSSLLSLETEEPEENSLEVRCYDDGAHATLRIESEQEIQGMTLDGDVERVRTHGTGHESHIPLKRYDRSVENFPDSSVSYWQDNRVENENFEAPDRFGVLTRIGPVSDDVEIRKAQTRDDKPLLSTLLGGSFRKDIFRSLAERYEAEKD
ncbi:MAG: hypothetical protein ABEK01_00405 [Candidatus Nanohaloarchaea archaeon]